MKNLFLLLLSTLILTACGLAEPTAPLETDPDETPPKLIKSEPINKGILAYGNNSISLTLDEGIKLASLNTLNQLQITSSNGDVIPGIWTFDENRKKLIFTLDDRDAVPAEQQFIIEINGEITDESGNALVATLQFNTPKLFNIIITATGLANEDSLTISQSINDKTVDDALIDKVNTKFIGATLEKGDEYVLNISQPAQKTFCTLSNTRGQTSTIDININVECHSVMPTYRTASDWNQYHATSPKAHGGELKSFIYPDAQSCDNLSASDALGAFDWICSESENTRVTFTSTGLKTEKNLSFLVNFNTLPSWKKNHLIIKNDGSTIHETNSGLWWNNPVIPITLNTNRSLSIEGGIYLILKDSGVIRDFQITTSGIALLVEPDTTFSPRSIDSGILVKNVFGAWIEGRINASQSKTGLKIQNSTLVVVHSVTVENAEVNGFNIDNAKMTQISKSQTRNNKANGLYISNSNDSRISDTISSKNTLSGIVIASSETIFNKVKSLHNEENGILITGNNNKLFNISISNNRLDGLVIAGVANNMINMATITSNNGNGLRFIQTASGTNNPRNNLLSNITIANNLSSGVLFEIDESQNNRLINVLDAYNATSDCTNTNCNDVKVILASDISFADFFSPVTEESNVDDYALKHFNTASNLNVFDNNDRAWGLTDGGICREANYCTLLDWSLNLNESAYALNQFDSTEIASVNTHTFIGVSEPLSFLSNAIEIRNDGIGNDNGLCETDESCLFTPNIGSYQGHGKTSLLPTDTNNLNASRKIYDDNGR